MAVEGSDLQPLKQLNSISSQSLNDKDIIIAELKAQNADLKSQNIELIQKIDALSDNVAKLTALLSSQNPSRGRKRSAVSLNCNSSSKLQRPITQFLNLANCNNIANEDMEVSSENIQPSITDCDNDDDIISNADSSPHNLTSTASLQTDSHANTWAGTVANGISNKHNSSDPKPSPIQLAALNKDAYGAIIDGLFGKFRGQGYRWHQIKSFSLPRILIDDLNIKSQIKAWLDENHIEYNTFAERGQKRKSYLLRGLMHGDDDSNISLIGTALNEVGVTGQAAIRRFLTGFMKRNPEYNSTPIYQITLNHDSDDSNLQKITTIKSFCVRIEKMKPSRIIQCHRCQRFSHTASMCL